MALESLHSGAPVTARNNSVASAAVMYAAALVAQIAGYVAIGTALDDMTFVWTISGITVIGTMTSFVRRARPGKPAPWDASVTIVTAAAFLMIVYVMQDSQLLLPDTASGSPARYIGVLLCWGAALRSFTLTSTGAVLFVCVPTIAMVGMSATQTSDSSLRTVFMTFVASALYMLIQEQLTTGGSTDQERREANGSTLLKSQLQLVVLYAVPAFILATLAYIPLSSIGSDLVVSPSLNLPTVVRRMGQTIAPSTTSSPQEVRVADGPVQLSDAVVMRVRAMEPELWRGATYDQYKGHGWANTQQDRRLLVASEQRDSVYTYRITHDLIDAPGPRKPVTQIFRIEGPGQFSEVYAAAEPRVLMIAHPRIRVDQSSAFHMNYMDGARAYRVDSAVPSADPRFLRADHASASPDIIRLYTRLDSMDDATLQHLRSTAEHIVVNDRSTYDRVEDLKAWIDKQCRYNTEAAPAPPNQDVVENFLFTTQEGYCDSFASALAVLCRTIGVPARVATGYISGDFDPQRNEFLVRDKHRHMWTEVYFPSAGWISFDATEGAVDASPRAAASAPRTRGGLLALLFRRGWLPPFALLCLLGMICYVLKVEVWDRLRGKHAPAYARADVPSTNREIVAAYERACAALAKKGLGREPCDTPDEYLRFAHEHLPASPAVREALESLTVAMVRFRYSAEAATDDDVKAATAAALSVRTEIKSVRRFRAADTPQAAPAGA